MNLETDRLKNGNKLIKDVIEPNKLKDSQEYFALALLKILFPEKYKNLLKKNMDRPDLKDVSNNFGVEVTTADSENDNEDNRLLSIYRKNNKKEIKKVLEKHGNIICDTGMATRIVSGGGYKTKYDNCLLTKSIYKKIISVKKYISNFEYVDLVVIKNEIVPSIWEDEIFNCVDEIVKNNEMVFRNIFIIYKNYCYCIFSKAYHKKIYIKKTDRLRVLGRLTAEGVIKMEDEEWN